MTFDREKNLDIHTEYIIWEVQNNEHAAHDPRAAEVCQSWLHCSRTSGVECPRPALGVEWAFQSILPETAQLKGEGGTKSSGDRVRRRWHKVGTRLEDEDQHLPYFSIPAALAGTRQECAWQGESMLEKVWCLLVCGAHLCPNRGPALFTGAPWNRSGRGDCKNSCKTLNHELLRSCWKSLTVTTT